MHVFSKKSHVWLYFCNEILDISRKSAAHYNKQPNLTKNTAKSAVFAAQSAVFVQFGLFSAKIVRIGQFWAKLQCLFKNLSFQRRSWVMPGIFRKTSVGPSDGGLFLGFGGKNSRKWSNIKERFYWKGEKLLVPTIFSNILRNLI